MFWLILSVVLPVITTRSVSNLDMESKGCEWRMQQFEDNTDMDFEEPILYCQIPNINSAEFLVRNMTDIEANRVSTLMLKCNDVSESSLNTQRQENFLSILKRLKDLRIENCKIRNITANSLSSLSHLKRLSIRSHNSEWSSMTLDLNRESFRGLSELLVLNLADNNIWSMPDELFCPLFSLTHLNLTRNKLQNILTLGDGSLASGRTCLTSLKVLDLSNNEVISLADNGFTNLIALEYLHLENNAISIIADQAFVGLASLRHLNLSSNCLVALPPKLFQSSRDLRFLYLQNNSLRVLAPGFVEGLDQLQVIDLSHNKLSHWINNRDTFSGLVRLVVLNLANNQLSRIDANLFHDLQSLQILNLEYNYINTIAEGAFNGLSNLHILILSHNNIFRIETFRFTGMYALHELLLDSNEIKFIHRRSFENITNLRHLGLNGNMLGVIPRAIGQLIFLETLDLGKNRIKSVTNSSFQGLDLLYGLRLVDNHIINIPRDAFSTLPSLKILNLASNKIKCVEQSAFSSNTILKVILLDDNELTDISGVFTNLTSLVWLNISSNKLLWFDFSHLPISLEWFDMHNNQVFELANYYDLRNTLKIKMLDVSFNFIEEIKKNSVPDSVETLLLNNNKITTIEANTFENKLNLKKVVLYGNDIKSLNVTALSLSLVPNDKDLPQFYIGDNPFYCDCNMEWLFRTSDLSNMRHFPQVLDLDAVTCLLAHSTAPLQPLSSLTLSNFLCPYENHCFAVCHCCDFEVCTCEMTCPDRCTCYHDYTWTSNVVDCSNAGYTSLPENIPMDATELYLDGNNLGELRSHVFIGKRNLEVLFLNNSNIKVLHNGTFNDVKSLKVLHLENNKLEELRGYEFNQLVNINELYLDHNTIEYAGNQTFQNMHKLEVLKLDENKLVDFSPWQIILNEESNSFPRVTLDGNKWSCDCQSLARLVTWIRETVRDPSKMNCTGNQDSKTVVDMINHCEDMDNPIATPVVLDEVIKNEQLLCRDQVLLLAATTIVAVVGVFLLVAIIFLFRQ